MLTTTLALAALTLPGSGEVTWFHGTHESAVEAAKAEKKYLLTYFWADTENCARLYSETMSAEPVTELMGEMVCFSANAGDDAGRALLDTYGLTTVPALLVTGPDGRDEEMITGFLSPAAFVDEMTRVRNGINTISDLSKRAHKRHASKDEEFAVRKQLAEKLGALGRMEESERVFEEMLDDDKKMNTAVVAKMKYDELVHRTLGDDEDPSAWDLKPMERFVSKLPKKNRKGRFGGYIDLAGLYYESGRMSDLVGAYRAAWENRPEDFDSMGAAFGMVDSLVYLGEELSSKERALALEIASGLHATIVASHGERCSACDGSSDDCPTWKADEEAIREGQRTGRFVTDRPTFFKPYAQYQLARAKRLNGELDQAIALMERVVAVRGDGDTFGATLRAMKDARGAEAQGSY